MSDASTCGVWSIIRKVSYLDLSLGLFCRVLCLFEYGIDSWTCSIIVAG